PSRPPSVESPVRAKVCKPGTGRGSSPAPERFDSFLTYDSRRFRDTSGRSIPKTGAGAHDRRPHVRVTNCIESIKCMRWSQMNRPEAQETRRQRAQVRGPEPQEAGMKQVLIR